MRSALPRRMTDTAWEDLDTLVFEREDLRAAMQAARPLLDDTVATTAPPSLLVCEDGSGKAGSRHAGVEPCDEAWLEELPAAARLVLEQARRPRPPWPMVPRIPYAVAVPAEP